MEILGILLRTSTFSSPIEALVFYVIMGIIITVIVLIYNAIKNWFNKKS